jgi:hypothetical protein
MFKLNQYTSAGTGNYKFKPITSHSFVSKVTSRLDLKLSKKNKFKLNQNTSAGTSGWKFKPITSHSFTK